MSRFQPNTSTGDLLSSSSSVPVGSHFSQPRVEPQAGAACTNVNPSPTPFTSNGHATHGAPSNGSASYYTSNNGMPNKQINDHQTNGVYSPLNGHQNGHQSSPQAIKPVWDRDRRELRLGNVVVKRFKWPAGNQERVLNAFENQGWPEFVGDPLDVDPKICPKRRLHDTLKCLNRKQLCPAVKFRGDGTGKRVRLEINPDKLNPTIAQ